MHRTLKQAWMKMSKVVAMAALALVTSTAACAQAQTAVPTTFDVATIRSSARSHSGIMINWNNGELNSRSVTLEWLLTNAFHARADQISGEPGWAKATEFDITAKLTDTALETLNKITAEQQRTLLLALLAERLGLKYHEETRVLPTYDLVPAKNGLKLTPADTSGGADKDVDGVCDGCSSWGNNQAKGHDIDLPTFAEMLASQLGRNVNNGTGYTGKIDVNLKWAPDVGTQVASDEDAVLPPLPQALEKQVGIHLLSTKGPVKLYVIDRLNQPSDN